MTDVDQRLAHVPKDLAVLGTGTVEQEDTTASMDASHITVPVIGSAVDQTLAHVPKDLAVLTDGVA
jgi:hypothetical protein